MSATRLKTEFLFSLVYLGFMLLQEVIQHGLAVYVDVGKVSGVYPYFTENLFEQLLLLRYPFGGRRSLSF
jgi:hypothetical protein